jgi:hypothetical protein
VSDWFSEASPTETRLRIEVVTIGTAAGVCERLAALRGEGWIQWTQGVREHGAPLPDATPLCGEVFGPEGSVHLRQAPSGGWRWVMMREESGSDHLCFDREYLSSQPGHPQRRFQMREYWRLEAGMGGVAVWRPWISRFCGWSDR